MPPPSSADALVPSRFLKPWAVIQITAAVAAVVIAAHTTPVDSAIALAWPGLDSKIAVVVGLLFWLVFGLVGGARSRLRAGGSVMTFSMPFIVAGTVLGGPFAGALLGLFSEFELREIRTLPVYATLANHAVSILSAVLAGVVGEATGGFLEAIPFLAGEPAVTFFVVAVVTAFTFAGANIALVIPTLALRNNIGLGDARRSFDANFRATSLGEAVLAWLMAVTYVTIGFWAPVVCVVLVLLVWQAFDSGERLRHDAKTGLLNELGFAPALEAALESARLGRHGAAVAQFDLDNFKEKVNDVYLEPGGDDVIREAAHRLLHSVRGSDAVARSNLAGDEFYVLLQNVADVATALRLVDRLRAAIRRPILIRSHGAYVEMEASAGVVMLELGAHRTRDEVYLLLNSRMKRSKHDDRHVVWEGDEDQDALDRRKAEGPRRRRA